MIRLSEHHLQEKLKVLFPTENIQVNVRKNSNFKYESTGAFMELDVWIPNLQLGFEFQDSYHYTTTWFYHYTRSRIQAKDSIKLETVLQNGLSLINVPCWWDGDEKSLGATIQFHRPELSFSSEFLQAKPIPLNYSPHFFSSNDIPGVGELMLASFPMGSKVHEDLFVHKFWWAGEKYDGMRVCWNSEIGKIYTRSRNIIDIDKLSTHMPSSSFLDSEFWFGRTRYLLTYDLHSGSPESIQWHMLRMVAFDIPSIDYHYTNFEKRYEHLLSVVSTDHPFIIVVPRVKVDNGKELKRVVQSIINEGGEGVIMRQARSLYLPGRNLSLIKLKTTYGDAEAIVIGKSDTSVKLKTPDEKIFEVVGFGKEKNLSVGDIVSFSFEGRTRTNDLPLNPKIERVRKDLLWKDVVEQFKKDRKFLNASSNAVKLQVHSLDYFVTKRMRHYLEDFAKTINVDPFNPTTWYKFSVEAIQKFQTGRAALRIFSGSYFKLFKYLFPEVVFDSRYFPEAETRRQFFIKYAHNSGFDPFIPKNWYSQSRNKIALSEGAQRVLGFHNNSVITALMELFPDIGFERSKFSSQPRWRYESNRKKFFEDFARKKGFDPYNPDSWYKISRVSILKEEKSSSVLVFYKNSVSCALMELFPNIGLQQSKFVKHVPSTSKSEMTSFFVEFAATNNFDPLIPENWYLYRRALSATKQAQKYYENKVELAKQLAISFPNIGFDSKTFVQSTWENIKTRRLYFQNFAKQHGFHHQDVEGWYLNVKSLLAEKGISRVLRPHNYSVSRALHDIFPDLNFDRTKLKT